jgi:hypothetical protein
VRHDFRILSYNLEETENQEEQLKAAYNKYEGEGVYSLTL